MVRFCGMIQKRITDPRWLGSWYIKGTKKFFPRVDWSVPFIHRDPSQWSFFGSSHRNALLVVHYCCMNGSFFLGTHPKFSGNENMSNPKHPRVILLAFRIISLMDTSPFTRIQTHKGEIWAVDDVKHQRPYAIKEILNSLKDVRDGGKTIKKYIYGTGNVLSFLSRVDVIKWTWLSLRTLAPKTFARTDFS